MLSVRTISSSASKALRAVTGPVALATLILVTGASSASAQYYYDFIIDDTEFETYEDTPVSFDVHDYGYYGDEATVYMGVGAKHGSVQYDSYGNFTYTPDSGYFGFDGFSYMIVDPDTGWYSNEVWTYILVIPDDPVENLAPVMLDIRFGMSWGVYHVFGRVRDESPGNRYVELSGALSGISPIPVNEDGSFDYYFTGQGMSSGSFQAWTEDEYEAVSNSVGDYAAF